MRDDSGDEPESSASVEPRAWRRRRGLTVRERRIVAVAAAAPFGLVLLALLPFVAAGPASLVEAVLAALVYGVLLGLAAAFVTIDRIQARQCPGCGTRNPPGQAMCSSCGYDVATRPRWMCDQRHQLYLDPGLCDCGRRLQPLPPARGIGREVVVMLKIGGWLFAFLLGMGVLVRVVG